MQGAWCLPGGFYAWERRAPSDRDLADAWLTEKIRGIHAESKGTYGARRVHADLRLAHDVRVGRKRVERLMALAGISGQPERRRRRTTIRLKGVRVAPDLVERDFNPVAPDCTWSADITYIRTWEGWLYLAHVQDLFSRRIVGWAMADHLRAELVIDALQMALSRRKPGSGSRHLRPVDMPCCGQQAAHSTWTTLRVDHMPTGPTATSHTLRQVNPCPRERGRSSRPDATPSSADPRAGALAGKRSAGTSRLLRGARQHRHGGGLPNPGDPALVQGAPAS